MSEHETVFVTGTTIATDSEPVVYAPKRTRYYAVDTWDDLDDYGVSFIERKLYASREDAAAKQHARPIVRSARPYDGSRTKFLTLEELRLKRSNVGL